MPHVRPLAVTLLLALAPALVACGGESEEEQVRAAVAAYADASADKDYQRICDELIAETLVQSVESVGLPCELAFKEGLERVREPEVDVREVRINRSKALVEVTSTAKGQQPSQDTLELVLQGGDWRISALAKPQPQPPLGRRP